MLVLDNAETPWGKDVVPTEDLLARLAAVPGLALLCTFRGTQRPQGPSWADSVVVGPLVQGAARELFLATAGSGFDDDPVLDELLVDLEGWALGVELLGRLAQPEATLAGLHDRWKGKRADLLSIGTDPDRTLSVAVSLELSLQADTLSNASRDLLGVVAFLADGVAHADLAALFDDGIDAAAGLRAAGLAFDDQQRLRVLAPIRDYVTAHYPAGTDHASRARDLFLTRAERLGPEIGHDGGAPAARDLNADLANITWAITTALDSDAPAEVVAGIDATLALSDFAQLTSANVDALILTALDRAEQIEDLLRRAKSLHMLGVIALARSEHDRARERFEHALPLYQQAGDGLGEANCFKGFGTIALELSDSDRAREQFEQALSLYRQASYVLGEANCIFSLGHILLERLDSDGANKHFEQALALYQQVGSTRHEANCIFDLGHIALQRSDPDGASEQFERALQIYQRAADLLGEANCISSLGDAALVRSDHDHARARFEEALQMYTKARDPYSIGATHERLARAAPDAATQGRHVASARAAFASIDRPDLIIELETEFPAA